MIYQEFRDFDAYEDAIQHAQVRMTLHRRERPRWAVGQMCLGTMHFQWGTSGGGMVSEGEILPGGYALFVPLSDWSTNGVNGCRLDDGSIMIASAGSEFCISADGWNDWFSLFLSRDLIRNDLVDINEKTLRGCRVVRVGSRPLHLVRRVIRRLIHRSPDDDVTAPDELSVAEAMLLQLVRSAITQAMSDEHRGRGRPIVDRHRVVRSAANNLPTTADEPVCVRDLAKAAGVSERTLHRVFREWFGVSPVRYARLRQLHSVRDALLAANRPSITVTEALIQNDIDQFGRFAGRYRSLFGELPSETLSRSQKS